MNNPSIDDVNGRHALKYSKIKVPGKFQINRPIVNLVLFILTIISTFLTGYGMEGHILEGVWYSSGIISILLAHEMGHYFMCRKYGIAVTLPFFIPLPFLSPFGTLGAVIKMESFIPSRKALFDVAVAGPLAGLAFTIPAIYFGVQLSDIVEKSAVNSSGVIHLGESLLYQFLSFCAIGSLSETKELMLHPLAFAGWAGLFVTALNLLPIGQLDGGHIIYALVGKHHRVIAITGIACMLAVALFWFRGWIPLLLLLLWFGIQHPPTMDERPVGRFRVALGIITLIVFALSFTPKPLQL